MDVAISQSFVKSSQLVIDEDGSVKDSAVCILIPFVSVFHILSLDIEKYN